MPASAIDTILEGRRSQPQQLVEVLQDVQVHFGYIPEAEMRVVSTQLGVPEIEVFRVANFYKAFSLAPRGENIITVCAGTACHVRGSQLLVNQVFGQLGIAPGETTQDGMFTLEQVNCLGACALGPVVVVNGTYHDHMTPGKLRRLIETISRKGTEGAADAENKGKTRKSSSKKTSKRKRA